VAARKAKARRKSGLLIDVARVISVGRDRSTGAVHLRFRDERGRIVAVRLRPRQFRTLANGVLGLAEAMKELSTKLLSTPAPQFSVA
jgi:hypothetical protein